MKIDRLTKMHIWLVDSLPQDLEGARSGSCRQTGKHTSQVRSGQAGSRDDELVNEKSAVRIRKVNTWRDRERSEVIQGKGQG